MEVKNLAHPEFKYSDKSDSHLDNYLMELWPEECKELDVILERGKVNTFNVDDELDRYYELKTFLLASMKGSISRYFNPRRTHNVSKST